MADSDQPVSSDERKAPIGAAQMEAEQTIPPAEVNTHRGGGSDQTIQPSDSADKDVQRAAEQPVDQTIPPPSGASAETSDVPASDQTLPPGGSAAPADKHASNRFGDYEILQEIARGGMGVVYKARQVSLNRTVALKKILSGQLAGEEDLKRFQVEAEASAQLDHVGIVPVYDFGQVDGQYYFSMGFVEGDDLAERIRERPMDAEASAEMMIKIARAVGYANAQGVIHRDLKPSNVLLDGNNEPKVTDFGVAKQQGNDSEMTAQGQILGTPSYMPPEQAAGQGDEVDQRSDVYALGAILYALLTGRPPFQAATAMETMIQVLDQEPVPISQLNSTIPRDLETICLKCLQKEPAKRYASAEALAEDLQRYLEDEPIVARPPTRAEQLGRWVRKNKGTAIGTGLVAAALIVATLISIRFSVEAGRQRDVAAEQRDVAAEQRDAAELAKEEADRHRKIAEDNAEAAQLAQTRTENLLYVNLAGNAFNAARQGDMSKLRRDLVQIDRLKRGGRFEVQLSRALTDQSMAEPLDGHSKSVTSVGFSPDGKRLASGSEDQTIQLWDMVAGKTIGDPMQGHQGQVASVVFSPDGKTMASASWDKTIRLWDAMTGETIGDPLQGHESAVLCIAFSPDGKRLASGSWDNTIRLWDVMTREPIGDPIREHQYAINSIAYSPDGKRLASGSNDHTIRLRDAITGEAIGDPILGHEGEILSVTFSPDGKRLASGSSDQTIRFWDVLTGQAVGSPLRGHEAEVLSVVYSPDGKRLASGSWDNTIRLWDVMAGEAIGPPLRGHENGINSVVFRPDGNTLASASRDQTIRIWDPLTVGLDDGPLGRHESEVTSVAFSPDGKVLASASSDHSIRLWDAVIGESIGDPLLGHEGEVLSVAFSPDGKTVASGGRDKMVRLWDAGTGEAMGGPLQGHTTRITSLVFSPDGKILASGCLGSTIRLWDVAARETMGELPAVDHYITSLAFGPDGKRLASAGLDNLIRLWDVGKKEMIGDPLQGHQSLVESVAFSPDGKVLASGSHDATIRLWNSMTGEAIAGPLRGHAESVTSVSFSPDGKTLASGSWDDTIRLWDLTTGEAIGDPIRGHADRVNSVAISPDGKILASGSRDTTIQIWHTVPLRDRLAMIRARRAELKTAAVEKQTGEKPAAPPDQRAPDEADSPLDSLSPGLNEIQVEHEGQSRRLLITAPAAMEASRSYPVLFCFHGAGGKADGQSQRWSRHADPHNLIVVSCEAVQPMAKWNFMDQFHAVDHDDVGLVVEVAKELIAGGVADSRSIYATGHSSGGLFCYRLAKETDVFAAFAPMSCGMAQGAHTPADPTQPVSILQVIGDRDKSFHGSINPKVTMYSAAQRIDLWRTFNGCDAQPVINRPSEKVTLSTYANGDGMEVVLCEVKGEGHHLRRDLRDETDGIALDFLLKHRREPLDE